MILKEYRVKNDKPITDERILGYISDCIGKMIDLGYDINERMFQFLETDSTKTFGSMAYDFGNMTGYEGEDGDWGKYILRLSKHMFNEPEKSIKNTIFHELCHTIAMQDDIDDGTVFYDGYSWKLKRGRRLSGHGPKWQRIASIVGNAIGDTISRTDNYITHSEVGKKAKERSKWSFECPECHSKINYQRKTEFVKHYNDVSSNGEPLWYCARCKRNLGKKIAFNLIDEDDNNENN